MSRSPRATKTTVPLVLTVERLDTSQPTKMYGMTDELTVRKIGPDGSTVERFTTVYYIDREVTFDARTA